MASLAAIGERTALAMQRLEAALAAHAGRLGIEAPVLPGSKDPAIAHAARLDAIAAFLERADAKMIADAAATTVAPIAAEQPLVAAQLGAARKGSIRHEKS